MSVISHSSAIAHFDSMPDMNVIQLNFDSLPSSDSQMLSLASTYLQSSISPITNINSLCLHLLNNGYNKSGAVCYTKDSFNFQTTETWDLLSPRVTYGAGYVIFRNQGSLVQSFIYAGYDSSAYGNYNGFPYIYVCVYNDVVFGWGIFTADSTSFAPGDTITGRSLYVRTTEFKPNGIRCINITINNYIRSDPYEHDPGGPSGTGGGGGSFDNTSTPINIPNLPSISAASTGFISLYNPSLNQLNELASYLWSDLFEISGWKKLFADPMDAILGLSIVPVAVPSGGAREVKVGNIGTGISLTVASTQFVEVDCGSIDVNEYWGAYLDYEPYTQAQIFLPYIGTRPISVDEIMGKTVRVVYHVDILTGACCCFVKCGDSVLYTYNGQCSIPIPITGANYTSVVNGVIGIAASVGSLVATGGSSAPTAIPEIASSVVNQMKPRVEKSGSISGSAGVLNMQTPYLILIRPRQALPSKQNEFIGYPSLITVQLTELKGYTEVQSIHLENIPATQEELAEIESLLKGGVIF